MKIEERLTKQVFIGGTPCFVDTQGHDVEADDMTAYQIGVALRQLHAYESTGLSPTEVEEMRQKQIPKEPIKKDTTDHFCYVCPVCGHGVWGEMAKAIGATSRYCSDCGQRLK